MKTKSPLLFLLIFTLWQSATSQSILPKIENYTKGDIELKITSFGEENPIKVGRITADGTIHFDWPKLDMSTIIDNKFYINSIKNFTGAKYCKDPNKVLNNEEVQLVETKFVYLFKYDQVVGCIVPSTQKGQEHNEQQLGTTINWIYSYEETNAKVNCIARTEWEDYYRFDKTTNYDLTLKKGWNLISKSLTEIHEWEKGTESGRLPKTKVIKTLDQIPDDIHWHLKYWANDELIELERALIKLPPLTKSDFERWLPKRIGSFKRTGYELGKTLERLPITNNVNILFEKGSKKIDLTIVDCAGDKKGTGMFTLMLDIASRDWHDKTETGYEMASKRDDYRIMTEYIESETKTTLSYNAEDRYLIKAVGTNLEPEELWKHLKTLDIEALNNE